MPSTPRSAGQAKLFAPLAVFLIAPLLVACEDEDMERAFQAGSAFHEVMESAREDLATVASEVLFGLGEEFAGEALVDSPVGHTVLSEYLPEDLGGFEAVSRDGAREEFFDFAVSWASADYENASGVTVEIGIADLGAIPAILSEDFLERWDIHVNEESARGWELTTEFRGYRAFEEFRRSRETDGRGRAEILWIIEERFAVFLEGRDVTIDEMHDLIDRFDVEGLARMRGREGR